MSVTSGFGLAKAKALLNHALGAAVNTPDVTLYLALFSVACADGAAGTEATGTGYARVAITNNATNFPAATGSTTPVAKSLHIQFAFPTAGADWSAAANQVGWGLFDASSAGNLVAYGPLTVAKPVLSGDTPTFAADALSFTGQ